MAEPNFWDNQANSHKLMQELKQLKSATEPYQKSLEKLNELKELTEISAEDQEFLEHIADELASLERDVGQIEIQTLLRPI